MNKIHLSEEAQDDLIEIKTYIETELLNPSAALAVVSRVMKSIRLLRQYAEIGTPLSSITHMDSDYRFIISGHYISFYRICEQDIYVERILYVKRDYMRILFGDNIDTKEN